MKTLVIPALCALPALTTPALATAQTIPAGSEVVINIDWNRFVGTPMYDALLDEYGPDKARAQMRVLENLTDLNLEEDLRSVSLWGELENDDTIVIQAQGAFNPTKLIDIVRLNEDYEEIEIAGYDAHFWYDDGDKFGVFPEEDILLIANSEDALEIALSGDEEPFSRTPAGSAMPRGGNGPVAWMILAGAGETRGDFGELARATEMQHMLLSVETTGDGLSLRAEFVPHDDEFEDAYHDIARGMLSAAMLLQEEEEVAGLIAETTTLAPRSEGPAVFTAELGAATVIDLIEAMQD